MLDNTIKVLGIAGSLRRDSFNKALLRATLQLAPDGMGIDIYDHLGNIPPFNQDTESGSFPDIVNEFKERIRAADGIPGVLKNTIDWASRPYGDSAWEGKPLAIMGASTGQGGSVRAQLQLRHAAVFLNMFPLNLTDATARRFVREHLEAFAHWIERLRLGQSEAERVMERSHAV